MGIVNICTKKWGGKKQKKKWGGKKSLKDPIKKKEDSNEEKKNLRWFNVNINNVTTPSFLINNKIFQLGLYLSFFKRS